MFKSKTLKSIPEERQKIYLEPLLTVLEYYYVNGRTAFFPFSIFSLPIVKIIGEEAKKTIQLPQVRPVYDSDLDG